AAAALLPVTRAQCAASSHPAERCVCWRPGEDWYDRCAPGAPGSVAAWRVEPRAAVRCWRALQNLAARVVARRARPVLWGGRVRRPATRLERALGYRAFVVLGDRWLRPGIGKIRWCATCGCRTPHTPSRRDWFCDATTHDLAPNRRAA
ncbi:MAG: hypothetical protein LC790_20335, partial [Actinobacteria bacterium]|nr:hypothetical protein [Actinomycetota bacterium]